MDKYEKWRAMFLRNDEAERKVLSETIQKLIETTANVDVDNVKYWRADGTWAEYCNIDWPEWEQESPTQVDPEWGEVTP